MGRLDDGNHGALPDFMALVTGKWTLTVISALGDRTLRFRDLVHEVDGVSRRTLAATLRRLERNGIVARHVYARVPARVEYQLTEAGEQLMAALTPLCEWADRFNDDLRAAQQAYDQREAFRRLERQE